MKKITFFTMTLLLVLLAFAGEKGRKVAIVKIKKGEAFVISASGEESSLSKGQWVEQGSVVKTSSRSFVKLSFIDKSTVNIGPKSEMKIERFSKDKAGVLNVISGKIRSKVTKNYLNMEKDKSKLFVRSKSAVMGVRGTDFVFSTNRKTGASTAILFEGSIVMNKVDKRNKMKDLESIVNKGYKIKPGQFSVTRRDMKKPTIPSKLSSRQFVALEKNESFISSTSKSKSKAKKSIAPPGLSGEIVASENKEIKKLAPKKEIVKASIEKSKGFVKGDKVKPVDGSIVHVDSGTIIPIGRDAIFDKNAGEWVSNSVGSIDDKGGYVPPKSFSITDEGKLLKNIDGKLKVVNTDIRGLDNTPSMDKIDTATKTEVIKGPKPASLEEIDGINIEETETIIKPPTPPGDSKWRGNIIDRNYNQFRRRQNNSNKTRIKTKVNRINN